VALRGSALASDQTAQILKALDAKYAETVDLYSQAKHDASLLPPDQYAFLSIVRDTYSDCSLSEMRNRFSIAMYGGIHPGDQLAYYGLAGETFRDSAASTIKVVLLVAILHFCETGLLSPDEVIDGLTVDEHCRAMITRSRNDSANALLIRLGYDRINEWLAELGFLSSELSFGRLFKPTKYALPATDTENYATALGLAKFYYLLTYITDVDGFLSAAGLNQARRVLGTNSLNTSAAYNDRLNAKLPADVICYHKTGENNQVLADGGIFSGGGVKYILVVFDSGKDRPAMQDLGANLYEFMQAKHSSELD
jgi:beta-lactamase class A